MDQLFESLKGSGMQGFREPVGRLIRGCDPLDLKPSVSLLASRAHVLAARAASLACEYLVGVAALGVEKLHYDRLRCDPLWVLLRCSSNQRIWLRVGEEIAMPNYQKRRSVEDRRCQVAHPKGAVL